MNLANDHSMTGTLTLILGGVRSGKSRFGQELARELGGNDVLFAATAQSHDDEMARRIAIHRESRPATWKTLEQPLGVGKAIAAMRDRPSVVLVDCLTLLVSNVLLDDEIDLGSAEGFAALEQRLQTEIEDLVRVAEDQAANLIIVSGEVGMGLVPEYELGRAFRDLLGWSNQMIAARAAATYWMVAGLPVNATAIASSLQQAAGELRHREGKVLLK